VRIGRTIEKKLICPVCDVVVADVSYRPLAGALRIRNVKGQDVNPLGGALRLRIAEQQHDAEAAAFVKRASGELIYEFRGVNGHRRLATAPRIVSALKRTAGGWVPVP
jgi:hypothetical protein